MQSLCQYLYQHISGLGFEYIKKIPYANTVGSIIYAMICSRPDISHGVRVVSRFMGNLGKEH